MQHQRQMSWASAATSCTPDSFSQSPQQNNPPSPDNSSAAMPGGTMRTAATPPKIRRRNRMITSCLECRRRKLKCDKSHPCTNCVKAARDCVFLAPALDSASQSKLTEIKDKVGSLERSLEEEVALKGFRLVKEEEHDSEDGLAVPEDERDLEPTPLAVTDALYEADGDDEFYDLGITFGKMTMGERVGGFFRPKIAEELSFAINDVRSDSRSPAEKAASSENKLPAESAQRYLQPAPSYIGPSTGFLFGGGNSHGALIDFLPSKSVADRLMQQYFDAVHPIARAVHRPTFDKHYGRFWSDVAVGVEPPPSIQSLVFAAIFSGLTSMEEQAVLGAFGTDSRVLVERFRLATESALGRANFLRSTRLETLQAFVMYLIPLCRDQVSRAHSALVGTAIRIAQCMSLHRDGQSYQLSPIDTQIRRLVWHQICFLDLRTCEAQGPQPGIRKDEYDTKMPWDVDDLDLHHQLQPFVSERRWSESTFCIIRFKAVEMQRVVWSDLPRVEKKEIGLIHVLRKIENFRKTMDDKYLKLIDERIPIQRCAKLLMRLLVCRLHVMVLHRYLLGVTKAIPARLRQIVLSSGTVQMEMAIQIETDPGLSQWAWYSKAYQQYHTALLLLNEVFFFPDHREADRIWACCDYIFETDPRMPRDEKARMILTGVRNRSAAYRDLRRMRAPLEMEQRLDRKALERQHWTSLGGNAEARAALERQRGSLPGLADVELACLAQTHEAASYASPVSNSAPSSSDAVSEREPHPAVAIGAAGAGDPVAVGDELMGDIDWNEWDQLFPPDVIDPNMNIPPGL